MVVSHGDGESGGCVRGGDTNSGPSAWPWSLQHITVRSRTAPHGGPKTATRAREGEVYETHNASRSQNTPHPGERPGLLLEPGLELPHRASLIGDAPSLAMPVLAAGSDEAIDSALVQRALDVKKKEEERKAEKERKEAKRVKKALREAGDQHYPWIPGLGRHPLFSPPVLWGHVAPGCLRRGLWLPLRVFLLVWFSGLRDSSGGDSRLCAHGSRDVSGFVPSFCFTVHSSLSGGVNWGVLVLVSRRFLLPTRWNCTSCCFRVNSWNSWWIFCPLHL